MWCAGLLCLLYSCQIFTLFIFFEDLEDVSGSTAVSILPNFMKVRCICRATLYMCVFAFFGVYCLLYILFMFRARISAPLLIAAKAASHLHRLRDLKVWSLKAKPSNRITLLLYFIVDVKFLLKLNSKMARCHIKFLESLLTSDIVAIRVSEIGQEAYRPEHSRPGPFFSVFDLYVCLCFFSCSHCRLLTRSVRPWWCLFRRSSMHRLRLARNSIHRTRGFNHHAQSG